MNDLSIVALSIERSAQRLIEAGNASFNGVRRAYENNFQENLA